MTRVALKGLWLRRGRAVLTALAVVLGVAMVCGTYVLTDTISKAFDSIFTTGAAKTSAVVTGRSVVPGAADRPLPASLLQRVRGVDGVSAAAGSIQASGDGPNTQIRLVGADGKTLGNPNAPKLGFGLDFRQARFNPFTVSRGRFPRGDGEVVVDKGTADKEKLRVGQSLGIAASGPTRRFTLVGVARYGKVDSLGGATIGLFTVGTAQGLLGRGDRFDQIDVAAAPGVTPKALVTRLDAVMPKGAFVRTGKQQAAENSADVKDATQFIQWFLLAFGFIALAVGAFVIYNTLSITVAQRIRELATLRALGASRRQVRRSVLLEGLAIGVLASAIGLVAGYFLAKGLSSVFVALGIDLPKTSEVLKTRTVVVSLLLGIVVTLIASIVPARRATRIAPVAAMQEGATLPRGSRSRAAAVSVTALVVALALLGVGAFAGLAVGTSLALLGIGVIALFVAVGLLADRLVRPIAAFVGRPARRLGGAAGRLAGDNATRNPARTARTAAALMIGLALITVVATLGQGLRSSDRQSLSDAVSARTVVTSENGFDPVPAAVGRAVAAVPGARAYPIRHDQGRAFGKAVTVDGLPPRAGDVLKVDTGGRPAQPGPGQAIVERGYADKHDLEIGSAFTITTSAGKALPLRVSALQERNPIQKIDPLLARVLIDQRGFDRAFPSPPSDQYVLVDGSASRADVSGALRRFTDVKAYTRAAWIDERVAGFNTLLNLFYVLLALSIVVSLFGMVNTLVLSVFERTREIGMLRAVGMSRRQVRRMVRHESIITALIGAALGLPLGLALAGLLSAALADEGLSFSVPVGALIVFAVVAVIAGVLAAIVPARRAAKLDVLRALQYE